jgi:GntR family transcriptional regulator
MELHQSGQEMEVDTAQQIAETIKDQIREGKLPARAQLPSESALSEQFKVSRPVARQVLHMLEQDIPAPDIPVPAEELRKYGSFVKAMQARGHEPDVQFLEPAALIAAPAEVAQHLDVSTDQLVLKRYRLQIADKLPYRLIESYYPADLFGEVLTTNIGQQPLFDWLEERHGLKAERAEEKLRVRLADNYESSLLVISPHAPVVDLERTVRADNGRIIEWAKITAVADRYTFSYKYDISDHSNK